MPAQAAAQLDPAAKVAAVTRAMNAALATKQGVTDLQQQRARAPTAGVKRAAAGAASDASSSEEDSDEAYAARHAPWELEERTRFMTYQTGMRPELGAQA